MSNSVILKNYGRLYNPPNWFYNPKVLTARLHYIINGTAYYKDSIPLEPGCIYIFKCDPYFKACQDENDPVDHVFFDFISQTELIDDDYLKIDISDRPRLKKVLDSLTEDFDLHSYPHVVAESYLNIILYELEDKLNRGKSYSEITSSALRYIHENPPSELAVANIADSLNININHLIRTFKKETGVTPLKYISLMKAELAVNYLRQGLKLEEIANKLGYSTVSALSVAFKTTTRKNLSEYR